MIKDEDKKERNEWIGIFIIYFLYVTLKFIFDSEFDPGYINGNFYIERFFEDIFLELLAAFGASLIVSVLIYFITKLKFTSILLTVSIILCSMVVGSFFLN
tara:strand:+ start:233 stop:535 length:303 start_codon:yes stop_codon:yes gene_type:complete